jgi:DNA-directed RNA polymerase specialized sigma24 family protein
MNGRSKFPLFGTDEGWPYPDMEADAFAVHYGYVEEDPVDLDVLELQADPHAFADLTGSERAALTMRFERETSVEAMAAELGCTHGEAQELLGRALEKMRVRLAYDPR